jgi:hypothetical protein
MTMGIRVVAVSRFFGEKREIKTLIKTLDKTAFPDQGRRRFFLKNNGNGKKKLQNGKLKKIFIMLQNLLFSNRVNIFSCLSPTFLAHYLVVILTILNN